MVAHGVRIRLLVRARSDAEEARLRVDGVDLPVVGRLDPGDVVADGRDLPAVEPFRRNQHREVRLAARARERGADIRLLACWRFDADDEHVLGEPAFVARHRGRDAEREALLAQQRVAAVAAAERPDRPLFGEVRDVGVVGIAGPGHIVLPGLERRADRMEARNEVAVVAEHFEGGPAHARHDAHAHDHVRRVGHLHAELRDG